MLRRESIRRWPSIALAVGLWIAFFPAEGQVERASLPQPLTLQSALTVSLESHPDLVPARARLQAAQIREMQVDASYGFDAFVELQPRASSRASNSDTDFQNDSRYGLVLDKRLTDFGRTTARKEAVRAEINARQAELIARQDQHLLDVMNRYFAVILADYAYRARNEQLALDYFRFSRMQERHERFEQYSELEVAEKEALYRKAYVNRHRADLERRLTRHELALTLGRPGELSSELQMPDLSVYLEREIPIYTEIVDQAIARSPIAQARRDDVAAARAKVDVAKKINSPVLSIQLEARDYYD
ncbi:MAG: TolC family protein, partial [Proteobacteria bacterium]|nr:TolC family protein [Pseudomonadota bacterium]